MKSAIPIGGRPFKLSTSGIPCNAALEPSNLASGGCKPTGSSSRASAPRHQAFILIIQVRWPQTPQLS
jgi:hypothetical protein